MLLFDSVSGNIAELLGFQETSTSKSNVFKSGKNIQKHFMTDKGSDKNKIGQRKVKPLDRFRHTIKFMFMYYVCIDLQDKLFLSKHMKCLHSTSCH